MSLYASYQVKYNYMNEISEQYRNRLIQKRYSKNTIDIYCNYFQDFCNFFKDSPLEDMKPEEIKSIF